MNMADTLGLYESLFCVSMVFGIVWMCTGQILLYNPVRLKWLYALNRFFFWCTTILLLVTLFFLFLML